MCEIKLLGAGVSLSYILYVVFLNQVFNSDMFILMVTYGYPFFSKPPIKFNSQL